MKQIIIIVTLGVLYLCINVIPVRCVGVNNNINMKSIDIVGHRGAADLAPENTLEAINQGILNGASIIEVDVHLTKDLEVVVCHDGTINRTTNGKGKITDLTLNEIKTFNIVDGEDNITTLKVPTLYEVINMIGDRATILIEIKDGHKKEIERKVLDILSETGVEDKIIIQSFSDKILRTVHQLNPEIRLEKLFFMKLWGLPIIIDNGLSILSAKNYSYVASMNSYYKYLTPKLAKTLKSYGKDIRVYTVNSPEYLSADIIPYLDGIITDRPDVWAKNGEKDL